MLAALSSGNQLPDLDERGKVERLQAMECQEHQGKLQAAVREKGEPKGEARGAGSMAKAVGEADDLCSSALSGCKHF